jgi:hypothetical protein
MDDLANVDMLDSSSRIACSLTLRFQSAIPEEELLKTIQGNMKENVFSSRPHLLKLEEVLRNGPISMENA